MTEMIVLDAVSVATIARAARDAAADPDHESVSMLPDAVSAVLRRGRAEPGAEGHPEALVRYAGELDEIAEAAIELDQREHELKHQLGWWAERVTVLEAHPSGEAVTGRELALFRGRISGAHAMQRHYALERVALAERHVRADKGCAAAMTAS